MKTGNKKTDRIINFLNGKAFYAIMCVCFMAIGVAAWTGVEGFRNQNAGTAHTDTSDTALLPDTGDLFGKIGTGPVKVRPESTAEPSDGGRDTVSEVPDETAEAVSPAAKYFVPPVLGDVIKDFSDTELQYSMTFCDMRLHLGTDLAAEEGTPVTASGDGTVTAVYFDPYLGTVVEIDHGNGITVKYCGLNSAPSVSEGDTVDSSTRIGTVAAIPSESVEQSHVHVEFLLDGKAVPPSKYYK